MDKTSSAAGVARRLPATVILAFAFAAAAVLAGPAPAVAAVQGRGAAGDEAAKDCIKTGQDGRKRPCPPAPRPTRFACPIENRLGAQMSLECDDASPVLHVNPGEALNRSYLSVPGAPGPLTVGCYWGCAGNVMSGVVVWNERWPEAPSCREDGGGGRCRLVFESNRQVVLVTRAGSRVLGDVAIKECSRNLWGFGGWLPLGLGCTYPKHDHPYYGRVEPI
ncbi:hypothetical protein ACP4OV_027695 [Aristida adscensionis]